MTICVTATGESRRIGETAWADAKRQAPAGLPATPGAFVRVEIFVDHPDDPNWKQPVQGCFARQAAGWKLVGLERMP